MTTKPQKSTFKRLMYQLERDDTRLARFLHFVFLFIACYLVYLGMTAHITLAMFLGIVFIAFWIYLRWPTKPE